MSTVVERIKEYLDYKGISNAAFEKSMGLSNAAFRNLLIKKGAIGSDKLENFIILYPEVSPEWLVTGKGEMLASQSRDEVTETRPEETGITDRLFGIIESQQKDIKTLIDLLKEKDEEISRLRAELDARKGGSASDAQASSCADVG